MLLRMYEPDALTQAIQDSDLERVRAILAHDPELAAGTPFMLALYTGFTEALALLRAARPTLELYEAAALGDLPELRRCLGSAPGTLGAYSADGWTALHLAAFFGHEPVVRELLAAGADVHAKSANAMTNQPLHAALAGHPRPGVVGALLAAGAEVNAPAAGGVTPLHLAASRGDAEIVGFLLHQGAARDVKMDDGQTPAEMAAGRGHPEAAALLS
ncbi:MAG: ankyrin repeat protein [Cyanobacteria bacterium RYN_339]|nr:ankyrin repeat protein [Cyanobacteria bacterium RYN_339]